MWWLELRATISVTTVLVLILIYVYIWVVYYSWRHQSIDWWMLWIMLMNHETWWCNWHHKRRNVYEMLANRMFMLLRNKTLQTYISLLYHVDWHPDRRSNRHTYLIHHVDWHLNMTLTTKQTHTSQSYYFYTETWNLTDKETHTRLNFIAQIYYSFKDNIKTGLRDLSTHSYGRRQA